MFNEKLVRNQFPILKSKINGNSLVYLDNAATSQKPNQVINKLNEYYLKSNANIHRGVFKLSEEATIAYESTRGKVAKFLNVENQDQIIFVKGVTEGINLVANCFSEVILKKGDEILISEMEHHANIVPWQIACKKTGAKLKVIPVLDDGSLNLDEFQTLLSDRTKLVSIVHVSNSLGTINPIKSIIEKAHNMGIIVLVDAAQSAPHMKIDIEDLGCDLLVASGHKLYGPTGVGILYGRKELLDLFPPYQTGGDMIEKVDFSGTTFKEIPSKFEAGTPNIAGVIGLSSAIDFINQYSFHDILNYENMLLSKATESLSQIDGLKIIGNAKDKAAIISFIIEGIHPHDIGTFLDASGIAIRTGHHCTMPLFKKFGISATARASFSFYNNLEDIDLLCKSLKKMRNFFK